MTNCSNQWQSHSTSQVFKSSPQIWPQFESSHPFIAARIMHLVSSIPFHPKMAPFCSLPFFTTTKSKTTTKCNPIEQLCHRFSLAELRAATNGFMPSLILNGEGQCQVYKAHLKGHGDVAIKHFKTWSPDCDIEFRVEVKILCQLHHPNVVPLVGFCEHKHDKFVVYDYVSNGSLHDCLHSTNNNSVVPLSWIQRLNICIGVARGLHYIYFETTVLSNQATFFWTIIWCLKWQILDFARSIHKRSQGQSHQELSWGRTWRLVWNTWSRSILWLDGYQPNQMYTLLGW